MKHKALLFIWQIFLTNLLFSTTCFAQYQFQFQISSETVGLAQFDNPTRVAVDRFGNIYIAERNNNRIQKFNSSGTFLFMFGNLGKEDGQFDYPTSITVDEQGNIYVVDGNNNRIQKFNSEGKFLFKFGAFGSGDGYFSYPEDIAVDAQGNIYVVDNDRIQKFNSNGVFLFKFGNWGTTNGQFFDPTGIAVDGQGNIYVADTDNHRIQKFNSNGAFLLGFGSKGQANGQFSKPYDITLDAQGNIYVADLNNSRIQKFTSNGTFLFKFGAFGSGDAYFSYPEGVAVDTQGNIYVADTKNYRVQKFDNKGSFLLKFGNNGSAEGQLLYPRSVSLDNKGNIYVADTDNHRIQKFNSEGKFLFKFGALGSADGQFSRPTGIALDAQGNIYVTDMDNHCLQKFDSSGIFLLKFGSHGTGNGQFINPHGIFVDRQGNIFVADEYNHRIQKFNSSGTFLFKFGNAALAGWPISYPTDITVDEQGNIYVSNYGTDDSPVQKFNSSGIFLSTAVAVELENELNLTGMAMDTQGNIYVADPSTNSIQKFNSSGTLVNMFAGIYGVADGPFSLPYDIALDGQGNIYVVDTYKHRIQKFASVECPSFTFSPTNLQNGTVGSEYSVTVADAPLEYNYTATGLPAGLSMSSKGVISGIPLEATTSPAQIKITAYNGSCTQSINYSLIISDNGQSKIFMSSDRINACSISYLDPGGTNNYTDNTNIIQTISPSTSEAKIRITFSSFDLEQDYDFLKVYDGPNTSSPLLGSYTGTTIPPTLTATNATGQLTFHFISDYSVFGTGWQATISCIAPPTISGFSLESGEVGTSVIITGTDFTDIIRVKLNSSNITDFIVNSPSQLTAIIPAGATSGPIQVITSAGTATSKSHFTVIQPAIVSITNTTQTYDGTAKGIIVTTIPAGLPIKVTYNGSTSIPVNAGSYIVMATVTSPDYVGSASSTLVISQAPLFISTDDVSRFYGKDNPDLTVLYTGFVNGETESVLDQIPTVSTTATQISNVGTYPIIFSGGSDDNYVFTLKNGTLTITKATQTIDIAPLPVKTFGDSPFQLSASTSSDLPVTITVVSGPATIREDTITLTGAGTVVMRAFQEGNHNFAATETTYNFNVQKATPVIDWSKPADITYGVALSDKELTAKASFDSVLLDGIYNYSPAIGTILPAGNNHTISLTFTPRDVTNFTSVTTTVSLSVLKAHQSISFAPLKDVNLDAIRLILEATASSGLPVLFEIISGPATLSGNTLTVTGAGEVVVKAYQEGDANYQAAPEVTQSFCIAPAKPVITSNGITLHSSSNTNNQWYLNGKAIEGATGHVLVASIEGQYTVSVKNPCGGETFSDEFTIRISGIESELTHATKLYPNPATVQVQLELPAGLAWKAAKVIALSGQIVASQKSNGANTIIFPTSSLKPGFYIIEIQTDKGRIQKKFIVQ